MNADVFYIQNYLSHKQIYKKKERKKEWCGAVRGKDRYEIFSVFQDDLSKREVYSKHLQIYIPLEWLYHGVDL